MLKRVIIGGIGLLGLINATYADDNKSFYAQIGTGVSFPAELKFSGIDPAIWDQAYEGYGARFNNTKVISAGIGYNVSKWCNILLSGDWRGMYRYAKYQTFTGAAVLDPIGHKNRLFDLKNTNIMLSFIINGSLFNNLHVDFGHDAMLTPFVGVGLGVAENTLSGFRSTVPQSPGVNRSCMQSKTTHALAAQGLLGVDWVINQQFSLDAGYRFYYGGKFKTNAEIFDPVYKYIAVTSWEAKLLANEVFVNLKYSF